jgi:acylphosphatase
MKWTDCSAIALLLVAAIAPALAADEKAPQRKHWFVSGQVQGVGFRAFTYESATDLKLKGWVRNLSDGRVEIVAEGDAPAIAKLREKVKKGPQFGRVDAVKDGAVDLKEKLGEKFEIRDSAAPPKEERIEDGR